MTETDFGMTKIDLNVLPEYLKNSFLYNTLIEKDNNSMSLDVEEDYKEDT